MGTPFDMLKSHRAYPEEVPRYLGDGKPRRGA